MVIVTNTLIVAGNPIYDGRNLVVSNCTLTANGPHSFNSVRVIAGGVLTHSPATSNQVSALQLTIAGSLTIDATARIDVTGRGYSAGRTVGNVTNNAASGPAGGSYGGMGDAGWGAANPAYGDYRYPAEPGSGGSAYWDGVAGAGGGVVRITANQLQQLFS